MMMPKSVTIAEPAETTKSSESGGKKTSSTQKKEDEKKPVLAVFQLRKSDLRVLRNAIIRCKTILSRHGGKFVGICKSAEQLHKDKQPEPFISAMGAIEFPNVKSAENFINGERTFTQNEFLDICTLWVVDIKQSVNVAEDGETWILFVENTDKDPDFPDPDDKKKDGSKQQAGDDEMNNNTEDGDNGNNDDSPPVDRCYAELSKVNKMTHLRGARPPNHYRITQWENGEQLYNWMKSEPPVEEMLNVFGKTSKTCYFANFTQDVKD